MNMFIDRQRWLNVIEEGNNILSLMGELKLYILELGKDVTVKLKKYLLYYLIKSDDCWSIILIKHN